ncbi:MAG TPA: AAC(3) family N-acetyltransferase [Stellaceae bacterium]|nr:AAC(3) family N-acetyltransferase [Stellaceae bacterium]
MSEAHAAAVRLLDAAEVPPDGVLFMHSAFRALAAQGFRAEEFIEGLIAYMDRGTLVMPTMTWRAVTPEQPVFDEMATASHVGIIPELFRLHYATHRSLHPTHSVAARGHFAAELTATHHLGDTPCAMNSPYGIARVMDAHVMLLGVGLERCTAMHHAEEVIAIDTYVEPPKAAVPFQLRARDGSVYEMRLRRHLKLRRDFPQFSPRLEARGDLRRGDFYGSQWQAFAQADLLDEVEGALRRDPGAIIAPPGVPVPP